MTEQATTLTHMAVLLVDSLTHEAPALYGDFLRANWEGPHNAS